MERLRGEAHEQREGQGGRKKREREAISDEEDGGAEELTVRKQSHAE